MLPSNMTISLQYWQRSNRNQFTRWDIGSWEEKIYNNSIPLIVIVNGCENKCLLKSYCTQLLTEGHWHWRIANFSSRWCRSIGTKRAINYHSDILDKGLILQCHKNYHTGQSSSIQPKDAIIQFRFFFQDTEKRKHDNLLFFFLRRWIF